jgi:hypothetical protein
MNNLIVLAVVCAVYALADYLGYNFTRHDPNSLRRYRVAQAVMQATLTALAGLLASVATAVAFNLVWWTFGEDILYYAYAAVLNPGGRWESRGNFRRYILGNCCTWAYWTPIGMLRGMDKSRRIAGSTLIAQASIGAAGAIALTMLL